MSEIVGNSKFNKGDRIRVLQGVMDPDFKSGIGGWTGEIASTELCDSVWLCEIFWDKGTISLMSDKHIRKCEKRNLNYQCIYLEEGDLELVEPEKTIIKTETESTTLMGKVIAYFKLG